MTVCVPLGRHL